MAFDQETKELARQQDEMDRLRENQARRRSESDSRAGVLNILVRGSILGLTLYLVIHAYQQL